MVLVTDAIPQSLSIVRVRDVIKQFGRFAALRGVTAEFDGGRFHAILGDNGAGKTTLLRALAGLADPTRGEISIFGKSPREACRDIGYMAHPSLLYDELHWAPKHTDFEEGLRETIDWYRANESWWRPLKDASEARYEERGQ